MKTQFIPELAELLRLVEEKFARRLSTTTDYELLSMVIEREIGSVVSSSTLKRLWGYVNYSSFPRITTLDTLSRYVGYPDFKALCEWLKENGATVSSFFTTSVLLASSLEAGAAVRIGWAPNRVLNRKYLGDSKFEVISSQNTKLRTGDIFESAEFILGVPLFLGAVTRADGEVTPPYVAGKAEGLNLLEWA